MYFDEPEALEVMSVFEFRYPCQSSPTAFCTYKAMIEPLAFFLRHPVALCSSKGNFTDPGWPEGNGLTDQDYIFFASSQLASFGSNHHTYLDLGALVRDGQVRTATSKQPCSCMHFCCNLRAVTRF